MMIGGGLTVILNEREGLCEVRLPVSRRAEAEAWARLFAAAPELLEAAEALLNTVCFGDHGNIRDQAYICLALAAPEVLQLQAAIAKAKA